MDKRRRRDIIRELLESDPPSNQRELVEMLTARGIEADQSTLSRDLREMGAVRMRGRNGGLVYGFPGEDNSPRGGDELRRGMRDFVIAIEASGNVVILRTAPGNAQAMAAILDRARLEEVAGTVAGDDTILAVVREDFGAKDLAERLGGMAG
ncbi:MAG: arginine repressor [Actinomycetota bacterium]|nr:arginine repressor [Actinomycetota bacterium]MDD5667558.1 arginine repressor [Actinomycetota bacterium]